MITEFWVGLWPPSQRLNLVSSAAWHGYVTKFWPVVCEKMGRCETLGHTLKIKMQFSFPAIVWNMNGMGKAGDIILGQRWKLCRRWQNNKIEHVSSDDLG